MPDDDDFDPCETGSCMCGNDSHDYCDGCEECDEHYYHDSCECGCRECDHSDCDREIYGNDDDPEEVTAYCMLCTGHYGACEE
jgi:hypothetical protein